MNGQVKASLERLVNQIDHYVVCGKSSKCFVYITTVTYKLIKEVKWIDGQKIRISKRCAPKTDNFDRGEVETGGVMSIRNRPKDKERGTKRCQGGWRRMKEQKGGVREGRPRRKAANVQWCLLFLYLKTKEIMRVSKCRKNGEMTLLIRKWIRSSYHKRKCDWRKQWTKERQNESRWFYQGCWHRDIFFVQNHRYLHGMLSF